MDDLFKNIKAVGFDLDGTLYKITEEMDNRIRGFAAVKILEKMPELKDIEGAKEYYSKKYVELESGTQAIMSAGYKEPEAREIMYDALEKGDISDLLKRDEELVDILKKIKDKYYSYLITKSPKDLARNRLRKIGIYDNHFDAEFFGDDAILTGRRKTDVLKKIANISLIPLEEHVYIGDRVNADVIEPKSLGMRTIAVGSEIPEADVSISNIHKLSGILL